MTALPESSVEEHEGLCWCCGHDFPEVALFRLGEHPEAAVCAGCARYLHRRASEAADRRRPSLAGRGRAAVRDARTFVVRHRWHERPLIGRMLTWIDRYLP